jgi:hypothetical protein
MASYKIGLVQVDRVDSREAVWDFAKKPVRGTEHTYRVHDANLPSRNDWMFIVRVPRDPRASIEIRPVIVPALAAWSKLERRSLTFPRATRTGYTGQRYCFVALADITGARTKRTASKGEQRALPPWFRQLRSRMRLKKTVRPTRGTDGEKLVMLVGPSDHATMIRYFFPTKVWPLKERRGIRGVA